MYQAQLSKLVVVFSKLITSYDGKDVIAFVDSNKEEIATLLSEDEYSLESIDLTALNHNTKLFISTILDCHDTSILNFVITIGKQFWEILFCDDKLHKNTELEFEYKKWLADYLLNISNDNRSSLIQAMMPLVRFNREFNRLLSDIVSAEDNNPRYDAFWDLWTLMQGYFFQEYEKNVDDYKNVNTVVHIGYGYEDVLVTYLLADFWDVPGVDEWHSLKQQKNFYLTASNRLGHNPTTLFSIS